MTIDDAETWLGEMVLAYLNDSMVARIDHRVRRLDQIEGIKLSLLLQHPHDERSKEIIHAATASVERLVIEDGLSDGAVIAAILNHIDKLAALHHAPAGG